MEFIPIVGQIFSLFQSNPLESIGASVVVVDFIFRAIPQKKHKSVLTVSIACLEFLLKGLKPLDEKVTIKKK